MMRLRRTYETAEEENKSVEEVALEKYGSLEAFNEALEERRILDERAGKKGRTNSSNSGKATTGETRYSFYDSSGPPSRGSFRKPGEATTTTSAKPSQPSNKRIDSLRGQTSQSSPASHTPIPSVMTPQLPSTPPVDLNKLQAKVLRAKLMGAPNADKLEQEYENAKRASEGFFDAEGKKLQVLPTMDGHGRLYDVGTGKLDGPGTTQLPGNRKKKEKVCSLVLMLARKTNFSQATGDEGSKDWRNSTIQRGRRYNYTGRHASTRALRSRNG
jgi:hypothetical protein